MASYGSFIGTAIPIDEDIVEYSFYAFDVFYVVVNTLLNNFRTGDIPNGI